MFFSRAVIYIMVFFAVLGAIDRILGYRFGIGRQFDAGFHAMGPLALAMIGISCLSPVLTKALSATIGPFFASIGADASLSGALFLSLDTGCYPLAHQMAQSKEIADFVSVIVASMLAPAITFCIPIGLGSVKKEGSRFVALGCMSGLIAIPFACIVGGVVMGLPWRLLCFNVLPIFAVAAILAFGLFFFTEKMVAGFLVFGKIMIGMITTGLMLVIFQELTGIILIKEVLPLSDISIVLGQIAIVLAGAYPCIEVVTKLFQKRLTKIGAMLGVRPVSVSGLIASLANTFPMMTMLNDMDDRGKTINMAFTACAGFALGDHLGFCAAAVPEMILPMVAAKLFGGVLAVMVALFVFRWTSR